MATVILTTVGSLIGGPVGGALGALLGNAVDAKLLAPKGRQGPRLGDLTVQTSSYGSSIPKLFGTLRVAGTVVWSTDLREDRHKQGGGKGRASTTTYSYSASFAVALSGRAILSVGRIWADGKLLRGAAGDWKSEVGGFRLHPGDEDGDPDPLIAAAEGMTPAYRGTALAVFEDLQLADFGNRIPSLTFEVAADPGPVSIARIADALSGGAVTGAGDPVFGGYAASGDSIRGAIEALTDAFPLAIRDDGARLLLADGDAAPVALAVDELGASADDKRVPRIASARAADATVPGEVSVTYYEPTRDFQAGLQRARRDAAGAPVTRIELPAALDAGTAKAVAERRLARALAERRTATLRLPPARLELRPGARVTAPGLAGIWRVRAIAAERLAIELKLAAEPPAPLAADAAPGRATGSADEAAGATVLHLLDLPPLDETPASAPMLWVAAAGTGAGWRRATLSLSRDAGTTWEPAGSTAPPATIGAATGALAPADATLIDTANMVEVELLNDGMWLESRSDDALVAGANLALIGDELIQFGTSTPVAPRRFRLGRLLRARRGTEDAAGGHVAGERFVLVERDALLPLAFDLAAIGTGARVQAIGLGETGDGVTAEAVIGGRALRPPAPVAIRAARAADGAIGFTWTRRSRIGWAWTDGTDAPLGEERETYRITITPAVGAARTAEVDAPAFAYDAAMQAADGSSAAATIAIVVCQLGSLAPGIAASASFTV